MENKIGEKTIDKSTEGIKDLLYSYLPSINRSFLEQDEIGINIGLKFRPHKDGVMVTYQINYVESRVKDGDSFVVIENQRELPFNGVEKVELRSGDRSVELTGKGGSK